MHLWVYKSLDDSLKLLECLFLPQPLVRGPVTYQHLPPSDFTGVHQLHKCRNLSLASLGISQDSAELPSVSALSCAYWPQVSLPDNCLLKHEGDLSFSFYY